MSRWLREAACTRTRVQPGGVFASRPLTDAKPGQWIVPVDALGKYC